jgi:hypothetical protein
MNADMKIKMSDLYKVAWQTGNLGYKVRDYQEPIYHALWDAIENKSILKYLLNISRRFGKTHIVSIVAVEFALRYPGSIINYAAPTDKEMNKILKSIMPEILKDCPDNLKPHRSRGSWEFKNGSVIYTAGVNNQHADDLRGSSAHLNIIDEAGMVDDLDYIMSSVLMPQQLTTDGTMLILSTPPREPDHDYVKIYHECKEMKHLQEFTILQNKSVTPELMELYKKEAGGEKSANWRREYMVEFVSDETKAIVEEWNDSYVQEVPRDEFFQYYHKYVAMDTGFRDNNASLFAYYDFRKAAIVIEDELILSENEWDTALLAKETKIKEKELWKNQTPLRRVADNNNLIILNDLNRIYQLPFMPVSKDYLYAMVNEFKTWVKQGRVLVNPKCQYLIDCIKFGRWDKDHKAFARSKIYQHYDALSAAIYLIRNVDVYTNPIPSTYNLNVYTHHVDQDLIDAVTGESNSVKNLRGYYKDRMVTNNRGAR